MLYKLRKQSNLFLFSDLLYLLRKTFVDRTASILRHSCVSQVAEEAS